MNNRTKLPFYLKISQILLGITALFFILYIGREIILPIIFSIILAILLNPMVNYFQRKRINKAIAIVIAILIMMLIFAGVFLFIGSQVSRFSDALPELKSKFDLFSQKIFTWLSDKFNISKPKIDAFIEGKREDGMNKAAVFLSSTIISISGFLVLVLLVPVYIFLFLYYKPLILEFIARLFPNSSHATVGKVLFNTKSLVQSYLVGLMIEMLIVATLDSAALLIIGVDYAIVLGVMGAILNLIPYIGGAIAISLPMIMALITGTPMSAVFVFFAYIFIQLIDNNYLVPVIVASKVKINALVSIIVVLIGGALWGVAGMFLSLPLTAIVKVICDHVEQLKPWGYLIGDSMPSKTTDVFKFEALSNAIKSKKNKP